jgi:hypothetical protein
VYVNIVVKGPTATPTTNVTPTAGNTTPTATVTATPLYRPFLGDWRRTDAAEGEISRVLIQEAGTNLNVNMWTKCGTSECDYGVTAVPATQANDAILELHWVKASYTETQQMTVLVDKRPLNTGLINIQTRQRDKAYTTSLPSREDPHGARSGNCADPAPNFRLKAPPGNRSQPSGASSRQSTGERSDG